MNTKAGRRLGSKTAENRELLLEAAEQIMVDEGYAALSARNVANRAGLKVPLLYYYFQDMDDLILELARRNARRRLERFVKALASADPLRSIWVMNRESTSAIFTTELVALANHRASIRDEIVAMAREFRTLQIQALTQIFNERNIDTDQVPPAALVAIVGALSRAMAQDLALGVTEGYDQALNLVEAGLEWLESQSGSTQAED
ncbi:MAG TPA: helix-turn-helix domain-containing protein [Porticoccaceae bacterium]